MARDGDTLSLDEARKDLVKKLTLLNLLEKALSREPVGRGHSILVAH